MNPYHVTIVVVLRPGDMYCIIFGQQAPTYDNARYWYIYSAAQLQDHYVISGLKSN